MLVVLDSTVIIEMLRGRGAVQKVDELLRRGDVLATTPINVEEVTRGLRPAETDSAISLFEGLVILPLTFTEGWRAGEWRRDAAQRGVTLAQADCLIAAATVLSGAQLMTANVEDFPMKELELLPNR